MLQKIRAINRMSVAFGAKQRFNYAAHVSLVMRALDIGWIEVVFASPELQQVEVKGEREPFYLAPAAAKGGAIFYKRFIGQK